MAGTIQIMMGMLPSGGGAPATTTLTYIPIYGQSLALGTDPDGASVITTGGVSGSYMFNGGVRAHYDLPAIPNVNSFVRPEQIASFSALLEQTNGATLGETFASGMATKMDDPGIFCSTGRAAYKVSELDRDIAGGGYLHFNNTYACALSAKELCDAAEYLSVLGPMVFKQGEADAAASTSKAGWKTLVQQLRDDFASHLKLAFHADTSSWKMIVDQQAYGATGTTYSDIAVGAIELHRDGTNIICAGPTYAEEFTAINDVHMTSNGYRNYGERLGRVVQSILDTGSWNPCYITGVSRTGTSITVAVHVPSPPLVVDTTIVSSVTDYGFTYSGATITDVSITDTGVGDNSGVVTITIDSDAGGTLGYAYNNQSPDSRIGPVYGPRGNIRDSESAVTDNDSTPLYNWLCVDQWSVA